MTQHQEDDVTPHTPATPAATPAAPAASGLSRRGLLLGSAAAVLAAAPLTAGAARAATAAVAGRTPKVLVIGLDGTMLNRIKDSGAANLNALMAGGLTAAGSLYANPMAGTSSGPGWSTVATGVWPDKHNVRDNNFTAPAFAAYPDFLTRAETARPALNTYVVASWAPIADIIYSGRVDTRVATPSAEYDAGTTSRAVARLRDTDPDAVFVQLDNVDHAGHSSGSASQAYLEAIRGVDAQVGQILAAVRGRTGYAQEDWLVMVTADHGHTPTGGHGGSTWEERQTFVIANGSAFPAGSVRYDVRMVDIAPTALAHLGIAVDPAWGLDGSPVPSLVPDAFDALRPQLTGRVDETGIPAGVLGFTHTPPSGWSVDNSAMGTGGVTEWRGWSFTTDEFWTKAQRDQSRELNVRARNVFAVADSDEWADKTFKGSYDSTLVSPEYPVAGLATVPVSFTTYYQQEGAQTAQVLAVWDGGAPVQVKSYTAETNGRQTLNLAVPAGASRLRLRFRYTGSNNWYWVLDNVRVGQS
ncbi:alkaline phosphatase family protein [Streptomyces sp. BE303]|uniref:alkaline phosphatase family protein n=1 Tax=Streptomyces sp. BE303 TaxID=3002528 RepID=UPI002E7A2849|nr:alkaline phosphatase family protein [Streptomyces sp. BE303]MED7954897.1 alkaline phosphatase family protein [Streptomyces sp. BE303]